MTFVSALVRPFVCLGLLALLTSTAWADVVHLHNGKVLRGKLSRATGDILEFKTDWLNRQNIQRLTLTNRRDVIELNSGQKHFGEIIYVDKFQIDMKTATGLVKIPRYKIHNIVLGTPLQQPMNDFMESVGQQASSQNAVPKSRMQDIPVSLPGGMPTQPNQRLNLTEEDMDAIPANNAWMP